MADAERLSKSCEKTAQGQAENTAAATKRMPDKRPTLARLFVMILQTGKVFLLAN
jgi:hypothetical protein